MEFPQVCEAWKGRGVNCKLRPAEEQDLPLPIWDGLAVGIKAACDCRVSPPRIYIERAYLEKLKGNATRDARMSIYFHEVGHAMGARCEPCADAYAGWCLARFGYMDVSGARAVLKRDLQNRNGLDADAALLQGYQGASVWVAESRALHPLDGCTGVRGFDAGTVAASLQKAPQFSGGYADGDLAAEMADAANLYRPTDTADFPFLVAAVGWTESHFKEDAIGPVGEIGVMQINPFAHPDDLTVAASSRRGNIEVGARILDEALRAFPDNRTAGIAAYNYGPDAIRLALKGQLRDGSGNLFPAGPDPVGYAAKVLGTYNAMRSAAGVSDAPASTGRPWVKLAAVGAAVGLAVYASRRTH